MTETKKVTRTAQTNTRADSVLSMFDKISEDVLASVQAKIDRRVAAKVKHLEEAIEQARPIYVDVEGFKGKKLEGIQHREFETLLKIVVAGQPVVLVGPAGTGKSHAAESVASSLGMEFYAMSVGAQTSKSDLIGYMDANKNYQSTAFRKAYEEGGLFLLDEIDAGNSNVLIQLNAALANGYMSFPDQMIRRHAQFRFIASANTFGTGANRQYVGRNQLDAATLDRFAFLQWNIDPRVEESLAMGKYGMAWLDCVRHARKFVDEQDMRIVVSPRATQRGSLLMAAGIEFNEVLHMALLSQFPFEEKQRMHNECHTMFRERCAEIDKKAEDEVVPEEPKPSHSWIEVWARALSASSLEPAEVMFRTEEMEYTDQDIETAQIVVDSIFEDEDAKEKIVDIAKSLAKRAYNNGLETLACIDVMLINEMIRREVDLSKFWDEIIKD